MKFGDPGGENLPPPKRLRRSGRHLPSIGEPTLDPNSLCLPSHIASSSSAYPRATQEAVELGNNAIPSGTTWAAQAGTSTLIEDQSVSHAQDYPNSETNTGRHSALRNSEDLGMALDNEDTVDGEETRAGQNLFCVSQIGMELGHSTAAGTQEEVNANLSTVDPSRSRPHAHDEVRAGEVEAENSSFQGASQERPSHLLHPEQQEHQTLVLVPVVEPDVRSQLPAQQDERVPDDLVADVLLGAQDARYAIVVLQEVSSSSAGGSNQFVEVLELSEDEGEGAAQEVPTLTSSALSAVEHSPVDPDAFAPEPCPPPPPPIAEVEAESSKPDQFGTQLESEGMTCSICMEPWTNTGSHRICSLACGHLFGNSCIKRWLKQAGKKQGKCPQCNRRARIEDLRTLYVPRLAVVDGDGQQYKQEVVLLRTENEQLKRKVTDLEEQLLCYQTLVRNHSAKGRESSSSFQRPRDQQARFVSENKRPPSIHQQAPGVMHFPQGVHVSSRHVSVFPSQNQQKVVQRTMTETTSRRRPLQEVQQNGQNWRVPDSSNALAGCLEVNLRQQREGSHTARPLRSFSSLASIGNRDSENSFLLQDELPLHGAKVFDMDAHSQLLLVSVKPPDCTASSGLTKMSLLALSEGDRMELPPGIGVIRDIQIAPSGIHAPGKLALMASAGKKLTLLSLESNNVVISYSLQSPSWACAWDLCNPNQIYTGLQNGSVLKFDMRQTSSPLATLKGLSSSPIHTLQYVPEGERLRSGGSSGQEGSGLLSASSSSLLYWPGINRSEQSRPVCLSRPGGSSVCVSLCYNAAVDMLVGSFKPKPFTVVLNEGTALSSTPPLLTSPTDTAYSQATSSSTPQDDNSPSTSISVHIPTHFLFSRKSWMPPERGDFSAVHTNSVWEQRSAMVGHKSQLLMSRTTIVKDWTNRSHAHIGTSEGGQGCLFASGDDGSNSVWLWEVGCPNVKQMLMPHPTPVLDIRNTHVAGMDLLGCVSERTLQIYRRMPL